MPEALVAPADQASGLRRLFEKRAASMVAFTSPQADGRASERTRVMLQFAADLLAAGNSVALLDEHPLPAGIASAYHVDTRKDLKHVLNGDYTLEEVTAHPQQGVSLIPAARAAGMEFSEADAASLEGNLLLLKNSNDCLLLDSVHRSGRALSPIALHAEQLIMVVRGNSDDLMPAYRLIKRIALEKAALRMNIVVVRAANAQQAQAGYETLRRVARDHLGIHLQYQGAALTPGGHCLPLVQQQPQAMPPASPAPAAERKQRRAGQHG